MVCYVLLENHSMDIVASVLVHDISRVGPLTIVWVNAFLFNLFFFVSVKLSVVQNLFNYPIKKKKHTMCVCVCVPERDSVCVCVRDKCCKLQMFHVLEPLFGLGSYICAPSHTKYVDRTRHWAEKALTSTKKAVWPFLKQYDFACCFEMDLSMEMEDTPYNCTQSHRTTNIALAQCAFSICFVVCRLFSLA